MRMVIRCATCGEVMGHAEKDAFTEQDKQILAAQVDCSQGHNTTELGAEDE